MLIVETGTGNPLADSYRSVIDLREFAALRGTDINAYSDTACEAALRNATEYVDTFGRFKGVKLSSAQALEFPRDGLTDWSGYQVLGVPAKVSLVTCDLAIKDLAESIFKDEVRGGMITSEAVGPITTSYAPDAPAGVVFSYAARHLRQLLRDAAGSNLSPRFVAPTATRFSADMHDIDRVQE